MLVLYFPLFLPVGFVLAGLSLLLNAMSQFWAQTYPGIPTFNEFIWATFLILAF